MILYILAVILISETLGLLLLFLSCDSWLLRVVLLLFLAVWWWSLDHISCWARKCVQLGDSQEVFRGYRILLLWYIMCMWTFCYCIYYCEIKKKNKSRYIFLSFWLFVEFLIARNEQLDLLDVQLVRDPFNSFLWKYLFTQWEYMENILKWNGDCIASFDNQTGWWLSRF